MIICYEPPSADISYEELVGDISSVILAVIEAENAISDGIPCSDKALNILSKQTERKQMKIKKLKAIIEKTETLDSLHKNMFVSLEDLHSKIKKRIDEANNIINDLGKTHG